MQEKPLIQALPGVPPSLLGESPFWHPSEQQLYWCDIPGHALHRFNPATHAHTTWGFDTDVGCCAPLVMQGSSSSGLLLLALRSGLGIFNTQTGKLEPLADTMPYDPAVMRFNDGKADPQGRLWVGSMFEPRTQASAQLYRYDARGLVPMAGNATIANGLAWTPDARTLFWTDTSAHRIDAFDFAADTGSITRRRPFATFPVKQPGQDLDTYGGRPDGAAMDVQGFYWVAMFEGQRLLRLAPDGSIDRDIALPARCPTMPCFGGSDLKTLYITTACHSRPAHELAAQPLAGCVLTLRVDVAGLPVNVARL